MSAVTSSDIGSLRVIFSKASSTESCGGAGSVFDGSGNWGSSGGVGGMVDEGVPGSEL